MAPLLALLALLGAAAQDVWTPRALERMAARGYAPLDAGGLRRGGWRTDVERGSVPLAAILSAGLERDAIPAVDAPRLSSAESADLEPDAPVLVLRQGGEVRAYPLELLVERELVNDVVGGLPVAVSFCTLCHSALAFERRADGAPLELGISGFLLDGNALLYDRGTHTLWRQASGEAVLGTLLGARLRQLPLAMVPWRAVRESHPQARVALAPREPLVRRVRVPDARCDEPGREPELAFGPRDGRLPPMERVVALGPQGRCVPFEALRARRVAHVDAGGAELVLLFDPRTASPYPAADGAAPPARGSAAAFRRRLDGRPLRFEADGELWRDLETGSRWSALGVSVAGPLRGRSLEPALHCTPFWFAWSALHPDAAVD